MAEFEEITEIIMTVCVGRCETHCVTLRTCEPTVRPAAEGLGFGGGTVTVAGWGLGRTVASRRA
eukprot:scaffold459792_cov16-Prasinocladus_malaysianus.AAC.2